MDRDEETSSTELAEGPAREAPDRIGRLEGCVARLAADLRAALLVVGELRHRLTKLEAAIAPADLHAARLVVGELRHRIEKLESSAALDEHFFEDETPLPEPSALRDLAARRHRLQVTATVPERAAEGEALVALSDEFADFDESGEPDGEPDDEAPPPGWLPARTPGRVAAGEAYDSSLDRPDGEIYVPEDVWVEAGAADHEPYVVEVRGDSMIDEGLSDGCRAAFYAEPSPEPGELVVAEVQGEGRVCKRYQRRKNKIELHSANAAEPLRYPTRYFAPEGAVTIYGVVRAYRDTAGKWHPVKGKGS